MSVIRQDIHGPFVFAGGYCFRPEHPIGYSHVHKPGTQFTKGQKVRATHHGGTPLASVTDPVSGRKETWHSHGDYLSTGKKSVELYRPDYECW